MLLIFNEAIMEILIMLKCEGLTRHAVNFVLKAKIEINQRKLTAKTK